MTLKKLTILSAAAFLLLGGYAQKKPTPADSSKISDSSSITGDTINIDESGGAAGGANGSADGMKSLYFGFGGYELSSDMTGTVAFNATAVRSKLQGGTKIKLEGNCDEFGTDEYNYALGLKRANAVKDGLIAEGISSSQITMVSLGESNPQCQEATDGCYAKNRRVDLRLAR